MVFSKFVKKFSKIPKCFKFQNVFAIILKIMKNYSGFCFTILYDSKIKQIPQKIFERILFVANIFLNDAKLNELITNY